jgi:hypothetical protein
MTNIIGITGRAQHGKNTIAETISGYFGEDKVEIMGFADALRDIANALGQFVQISDDGTTYSESIRGAGYERTKVAYPKARQFLQVLGTEAVRDILGEDTWINALDNKIRKCDKPLVVVIDVRFENEVNYILDHGELWAVKRPGFDNGVNPDHPSESYIKTAISRSENLVVAKSVEELQTRVNTMLMMREGLVKTEDMVVTA